MLQRYIFYYIKHVLYKNIFTYLTYAISNSYGLQSAKTMRADRKTLSNFRRILAKSAKNRTATQYRAAVKTITI